jgi:phosphoribosylamine--glycine ligase
MITAEGPKVVEFNARFGDPETQAVLPLLETDLVDILIAVINGELSSIDIAWKQESAVCVVMAAPGYPGKYPKGAVIEGLGAETDGQVVFHAGTKQTEKGMVTDGGRVLGVTGIAGSLAEARDAAYAAVDRISFEGKHFRTDIAASGLRKQR